MRTVRTFTKRIRVSILYSSKMYSMSSTKRSRVVTPLPPLRKEPSSHFAKAPAYLVLLILFFKQLPSLSSPVVENSVDHHPLWLDPITVKTLLHLCKLGVLVLAFAAFLFFCPKVSRRGLIHIIFTLVITKHDLAMQF